MSIAVTDRVNVYTSDGRELPLRGVPMTGAAIAEACMRHGITQFWFCDGLADLIMEFPSWSNGDEWDAQPAQPAPWVHLIKGGHADTVDIVFPHLDSSDGVPWSDAATAGARTLLDALMLYQREVGIAFHRSPSATAARLLRSLHSGPRATRLETIGAFPEPALRGNTEAPLSWMRPLTEAERGMRYLHSYDKNGAFLGACAGEFPIGFGEVEHLDALDIQPHDLTLPGYFLVDMADYLGDDATPTLPPRRWPWRPVWVTTPTLSLLADRAARAHVLEAWAWRKHHRILEPWQKRLRDARIHLMHNDTDPGAPMALAAVKATYSAFTGGYLASTKWDRSGDELYRPDIRHMIIARARCNLIRKIDDINNTYGILPVAVGGVDTLYFVSDEPDPVKFAAPWLPLGDELKHFKVKDAAVPLDTVRAILERTDEEARPVKRLAALQLLLANIKRGAMEVTA